ncbi:hypothetical protein Btru_016134 [Bulinus truncatus]|nr:hypothetical protein Btru_016134 [Bulinus truncatus]
MASNYSESNTKKKVRAPGNAAIAKVAASLYGIKPGMERDITNVSQDSPKPFHSLYTWTDQNKCLSPALVSCGGFNSPSLYGTSDKNNIFSPRVRTTSLDSTLSPCISPGSSSSSATPPPQDLPCICGKTPKLILCKNCGVTFNGRVRTACPLHPKQIFLMDFQCCISCQSEKLLEISDVA